MYVLSNVEPWLFANQRSLELARSSDSNSQIQLSLILVGLDMMSGLWFGGKYVDIMLSNLCYLCGLILASVPMSRELVGINFCSRKPK